MCASSCITIVAFIFFTFFTTCMASQAQEKRAKLYPSIPFGEVATVGRPEEFVLNTALPEMPTKILVYKVLPLESKKAYLLKILKALPVKSGPETENFFKKLERLPESAIKDEEPFRIGNGTWSVAVWSGGQFAISNNELKKNCWLCDNRPVFPAEDELKKAADTFLGKLPLLFEVNFSDIKTACSFSCIEGEKVVDVPTELYVSYLVELNGILCGGVSINVGPDSVVSGANSSLRRTNAGEEVPIITPQEALEKLRANQCHWDDDPGTSTCNIDSIKLMYYQGAPSKNLSYVMPVYVFEGMDTFKLKNGDMRTKHWKALVEAVRPEFLESTPAKE